MDDMQMSGDKLPPAITVSVVTPSYNQGSFLAQTIESVLSQEGEFFLDYIIIDGGSTDESLEVIKRFEALLASGRYATKCGGIRLRWVSEPDKGQTDALVKGFRMATGDILGWLNSDDTYYPGALQRVVEQLSAQGECGCLYGGAMYTSDNGEAVGEYPTQAFDKRFLAVRNFICQPATFFRRSAYEACGGLYTNLRFAMDYDLWIRMAASTRFCYLPELLATYRLHEGSKTVAPSESVANHAEVLATVLHHYRWAPLNRVYGHCSARVRQSLPGLLARVTPLRVITALCWTVCRYFALNKMVRRDDLMVLNMENLRLMLSGWEGVPSADSRKNKPNSAESGKG